MSTIATLNVTQSNPTRLNVSGVATFANGPVLVGSGSSTGTASQPLQVTGGAYVSGSLGVGVTNPSYKLDVNGTFRASNTFSSYTNDGVYGATANPSVITTPNNGLLLIGYYSSGNGIYYPRFGTSNNNATEFVDFGAASPNTFTIGTNKTERLKIDSSGRVSKPYQPHIFGSVTNSSTATNSYANSMSVVSSTELTFSNSRITVPVSGLYLITFCTISSQDSTRKDANIYINGSSYLNMLSEDTTTGYHYRGGSMAIKLSANDYIQFFNQSWYSNTTTSFEPWRTASVTFLG